ncbi:hypothetical protein CALCODRAFT_556424 [Calocera cornea HHB12733]|uniref:RING-type domain-containing protein n=1 Tax=Calocera cornea HHB12733 TaxID=1353952 RepID=A0A165ETH4_9BASI|nr:hypothetical protein CALCODRAFT_556424 [Calocera cornea HHB12733]
MQFSKLLLGLFAFVALAVALPVNTGASSALARRSADLGPDLGVRSASFALEESTSLLARVFGEDDESYLQRRDDCTICLEANAKHSNCPNGASHPAHIRCLIELAQAQTNANQALTCGTCRSKVSPLIKKVTKGKRDLEEVETEIAMRTVDAEDSSPAPSLMRRDDQCAICLEANAKHTNCPNGAAHPAHIACLMKWAQAQADAHQPLTCAACRSQISPLIKKVTKRELEEVDAEMEMREFDDEESSPAPSLMRRDDQCAICLEANAKHTNCPNGASHPAHIECLIKWAQAQADAGHALTCAACRTKISPLIKKVTGKKH